MYHQANHKIHQAVSTDAPNFRFPDRIVAIIEAIPAVVMLAILPQFHVQSNASSFPSRVLTSISHCQEPFKLNGLFLSHFHE
jgi:hypothetical protein